MASRPNPPLQPESRCRVLVVDDSAVARLIARRIVNDSRQFALVGQAASAGEALEMLAHLCVDIILLDIEMPGMNGITAIPLLKKRSSGAEILIVSSQCSANAEASIKAMTMGAADILLKPAAGHAAAAFARQLESTMLRISANRSPLASKAAAPDRENPAPHGLFRPVRCLALAASTGGLHALAAFLTTLPREIDMPMLITQHLPDDFMPYFANQMELLTGRKVAVARDRQSLGRGTVFVAPGDAHIEIAGNAGNAVIALSRAPAQSGFRPSADPMFASAAEIYGQDAIGVILSGMGRDGADGAAKLARAGGELMVQDRDSAVIWGMPGSVARAGHAHLVAKPEKLADYVVRRAKAFGWK